MPTDITTRIGAVKLPGYVFNASGPDCTDQSELMILGQSESAAIVTKSCTLLPRAGNAEPRYVDLPNGAIQSMGLPNHGYQYYVDVVESLTEFNKPVVVSISGLSVDDNLIMLEALQDTQTALIEINFSCPNIIGKPQLGYDFEQTGEALKRLSGQSDIPIGIKLPPYFDSVHFDMVAEMLIASDITFITSVNSVGNTMVIDPHTESPVIKPKGGYGGLCGSYIKPIGLANVHAFRSRLPDEIAVIGVGGVMSGIDAFEYLLAGADAVQTATAYSQQGPECFARIHSELAAFLAQKGYASISEARGKLKPL